MRWRYTSCAPLGRRSPAALSAPAPHRAGLRPALLPLAACSPLPSPPEPVPVSVGSAGPVVPASACSPWLGLPASLAGSPVFPPCPPAGPPGLLGRPSLALCRSLGPCPPVGLRQGGCFRFALVRFAVSRHGRQTLSPKRRFAAKMELFGGPRPKKWPRFDTGRDELRGGPPSLRSQMRLVELNRGPKTGHYLFFLPICPACVPALRGRTRSVMADCFRNGPPLAGLPL